MLEVLGDGAEARGGAAPVDAVPGEQQRRVRAYEGEVVLQDAIAEGERGLAGGHVERELQPALDGVRVVPAVQVHAKHAACLRLHEHPPPPHRRRRRGPLELLGLVPPGRAEETPQEQRRHLALDGAVQVGGHSFLLFLVRAPCGVDDAVRERGRRALVAIIGSRRLQTNHHQEGEKKRQEFALNPSSKQLKFTTFLGIQQPGTCKKEGKEFNRCEGETDGNSNLGAHHAGVRCRWRRGCGE